MANIPAIEIYLLAIATCHESAEGLSKCASTGSATSNYKVASINSATIILAIETRPEFIEGLSKCA
jgi:hypothetical protein